jgi:hypothetical protein
MQEKRSAAKSGLKSAAAIGAAESPTISSVHSKFDKEKRTRVVDVVDSVVIKGAGNKKQCSATDFPYVVDASDHAETPAAAYADIVPVLSSIAAALGKSHSDMVIFDPFYCQGSVCRNLAALGFTNVVNRKQVPQSPETQTFWLMFLTFHQDFYSSAIPEYDVLLTNPPYRFGNPWTAVFSFYAFMFSY